MITSSVKLIKTFYLSNPYTPFERYDVDGTIVLVKGARTFQTWDAQAASSHANIHEINGDVPTDQQRQHFAAVLRINGYDVHPRPSV